MDWLKDHIAEIVLGVAGPAGAGSLIALANDIASIVTSKPYAVMAIAFFGVVVGVLICYLSGLKEYRVEKLKLEYQDQEEERKKKEKQDETYHFFDSGSHLGPGCHRLRQRKHQPAGHLRQRL